MRREARGALLAAILAVPTAPVWAYLIWTSGYILLVVLAAVAAVLLILNLLRFRLEGYAPSDLVHGPLGWLVIAGMVGWTVALFALGFCHYGLMDAQLGPVRDLQSCATFSLATFFGAGFNDLAPSRASRPLVGLESMFGYFTLALVAGYAFHRLSALERNRDPGPHRDPSPPVA